MTGVVLAAAVAIEAAMTNGAAFLLSRQAEDGHWSDPQMPALTALPLWALTGAGAKGTEGARRKAAEFVLSTQRPDGSWANDNNRFWEADPVLCTSFAMIVLSLCR